MLKRNATESGTMLGLLKEKRFRTVRKLLHALEGREVRDVVTHCDKKGGGGIRSN